MVENVAQHIEKKGLPVRRSILLLLALCLALPLCACGPKQPAASSVPPASQPVEPTPDTPADTTPEPTPEPTPTPEPLYQFGTPVAESGPLADDSYFEDAAFVGDSRTDGLRLYGGLHAGDYLCKTSMSVFHADDSGYTVEVGGKKLTLMAALRAKQYNKVYIMLGLNELGYAASAYEKQLRVFLDDVIAAQPNAVIYLELMPPVNESMTKQSWHTNANVDAFNEINARVAAEKHIALLDVAEVYRGGDGQLKEEYASGDGVHFKADAYPYWADYLRTHIIDRDWYFASREGAQ